MDISVIQKIFLQYKLGRINLVEKIAIGFTNQVYSIDNAYILKICQDEENETHFEKEVFLYDFFQGTLPIPKVIVFDNSKQLLDKHFMIYRKIRGNNLYSKWHLMTDSERREIVKQLCEILRKINEADPSLFLAHYKLDPQINWKDTISKKIKNSIKKIEEKNILSSDFANHIEIFVNQHKEVLNGQKMALVYWDAHFDNILISDSTVVGVLDFERTELSSIDFVLYQLKVRNEY
jgi:aminoglycoside phosphotransferase (APT) family kinase protein